MYQEFLDVGLEAVKMAEAVALSYFRCDENDL
jgi:hypothetical protein